MPFDPIIFIKEAKENIKKTIKDSNAIIAVSGGVDSSTCAKLASLVINKQLTCVFIDTGLMRKNEAEFVKKTLKKANINIKIIDAKKEYFKKLKGVVEPEKKRKIIGKLFIKLFEKQAKLSNAKFLIQGTIAPDWIESGHGFNRKKIKSHHNVGGLPKKMGLKLCEPLKELYKHEVRIVAKELGLKEELFSRQPFPGPGLGVRIVGEITEEKAKIVREACFIVEEEIQKAVKLGKIEKPWQYFAAILDTKTVGVRGDERAYQYVCVIRAVRSLDGMTSNFSNLNYDLLMKMSTRITNEIRDVGRVFYDISNKPPATIEME